MKFIIVFLLLSVVTIFASEFGIDEFDMELLEDAVFEKQLHEKEGKMYFLSQPFTGVVKATYEDDTLALAESYHNGLKEGFSYAWYENGNKKQEFYYLKGQKHVLCYTWYRNGNMQMMANLIRGKFSGQFKAFDQDGYLHFEMFRTDDSLEESFIEERDRIDGDGKENTSD